MTFCDLFAGTGQIGREFKLDVKSVIANDLEYYSYVLNKNYIENHKEIENYNYYIQELNNLPLEAGFIYNNYCVGGNGERQYFSDNNGLKIDSIRKKIEDWKKNNEISINLYYFLLASLLESADKVANTASVYGAYLKKLKKSALKKHTKYLQDFVGLDSNSKVLDIGSGIGRSAIGLTDVLKDKGEYYGFDIVDTGVNWCNNNISSKFPNFHFKHIEIINDLYSDDGIEGKDFVFPYADSKFDIAFLMSVFTHMQVDEISNYLKEINRVLNDDGKCMATFFLYDDKIEEKISNPKFRFSFQYEYDNYRLMNNKVKNANIALSKTLLNELANKNNLKIERIIDGFWSEEVEITNNDFQDIVIFSK
jgi:ubiquinone/menaquinone biosynthesis C-methylase UbiE